MPQQGTVVNGGGPRGGGGHYSAQRVRSALLHFVLGRAMSAVLSVVTLVLLLRHLEVADYGVYVTLVAVQSLIFMVSSVGLDSAMERYLPELRVTVGVADLRRTVLGALVLRVALLVAMSVAVWVVARMLSSLTTVPVPNAVLPLVLAMVLLTGFQQLLCSTLDVFLLQFWSQVAHFLYAAAKLIYLAAVVLQHPLGLQHAIAGEVLGSGVAFVAASWALVRYLRRETEDAAADAAPIEPRALLKRVWRFAALNYGAQIMLQAQGPHGLRVAVSSSLGVLAAAQFGFVMGLVDLVRRYLPTVLLIRLLRPVFVSRYTTNRDFSQLNEFAVLLLRLNAILVAPVIAIIFFFGDLIVYWVAGAKYADTYHLFALASLLLVTASHMGIISLLANTLEKNALQFQSGIFALAGLATGLILATKYGTYGIIWGALLGSFIYNVFSVVYLRRRGFSYSQPFLPLVRIFFLAGTCFGSLSCLSRLGDAPWMMSLAALAASLLYLVSLKRISPIDAQQRKLLERSLPRRLHRALSLLT